MTHSYGVTNDIRTENYYHKAKITIRKTDNNNKTNSKLVIDIRNIHVV